MKIIVDEQVSVWKRYKMTFTENYDILTPEKLKDLIENGHFDDMECVEVYPETESHIQYDFDTVEVEK